MKKELEYLAGTESTNPVYQQYMQKLEALQRPIEDFQNELYMLSINKPSPEYSFAAKKVADKLNQVVDGLKETKAELEYYLDHFVGK